jgi:hypothetical protein
VVDGQLNAVEGSADMAAARRIGPDVRNGERRQHYAFAVAKGDAIAGREYVPGRGRQVQRDRRRPDRFVRQPGVLRHGLVLFPGHEPAQRGEAAVHEQFQIAQLPGSQIDRRPRARLNTQLRGTVGRNEQVVRLHDVSLPANK